ncbi:hypothetical protein FBU31_003407 [Coemansia sp. 'formosensis']|nr:hypothetical protein FBU31_003407 [Coemansia sp. 'formosensis']
MWFMAESYNCPTIALARKNAPTLQYLVITSEYPANLAGLIQNPDGSYVTFPCMYVLKFRDGSEDRVPERVTFWGAVPFPRLRHIESDSSYPFGDDVLFRGNSGTLEHLELLISDLLVSIIIEYNVFTPTGHPNLRRVLTKYPVDEMPIFFDTTADALQFMLSIGSGAPRRELEGDHSSSDLAPAFLSTLNHASIQVLTLSNFIPELADVIALISSLPALSNLRTSPPVIGSITNDVDRDKLPSYILSTYAPVSRRFRYLDHLRFQMTYRLDNVRCVLLVALAYPNYTYSDQDGGVGKRLKNELKRVIASDMFKPHVSRLQSFLNNCIGSL